MLWFKDVAWNDLAVAAVACLGPVGVWFPFWFEHQEKSRGRRQRQLVELQNLSERIREDIKPWANEWPETSYDPQWYLYGWQVRPFEVKHVENFNRVVIAGDYPPQLTGGLVRLEGAARRYHEALARHEEFRKNVPEVVKQNLQPVYAEARRRNAPLSDEEIARLSPGLGDEGRRWVQDLFQSFRRLHVEAIGRRGQDGLYEAWRSVVEQIAQVQATLQAERDTWWYWVGHSIAFLLAVTGALFLADFWLSFAGDRLRPAPPPASAPASAPSPSADTTRAAAQDTSTARVRSAPPVRAPASPAARPSASPTTTRDTARQATADTSRPRPPDTSRARVRGATRP